MIPYFYINYIYYNLNIICNSYFFTKIVVTANILLILKLLVKLLL